MKKLLQKTLTTVKMVSGGLHEDAMSCTPGCTAEVTKKELQLAVHKIWVRELVTVAVLLADSQCRCRSFLSDPRGPLFPRPVGHHVERGMKQIGQQKSLVALEHE